MNIKWITFGVTLALSALNAAAGAGLIAPAIATDTSAVVMAILGAFHISPTAAGAISKP